MRGELGHIGVLQQRAGSSVTESGGLAAHCSKANEEAGLVERKVCFILDAGNGGEGRTLVQKLNHSSATGQRAFKDGGRRLHAVS